MQHALASHSSAVVKLQLKVGGGPGGVGGVGGSGFMQVVGFFSSFGSHWHIFEEQHCVWLELYSHV